MRNSLKNRPETGSETRIGHILARYHGEAADLIPILQDTQCELGFIPEQELPGIAAFTGVPRSKIYGVASFYPHFKFVPTGRNSIRVCRGAGCYVKDNPRLLDNLETLLGIRDGQTTPDGEYTLETIGCFGACHQSPVMLVNSSFHVRVTLEKAREILGLSV